MKHGFLVVHYMRKKNNMRNKGERRGKKKILQSIIGGLQTATGECASSSEAESPASSSEVKSCQFSGVQSKAGGFQPGMWLRTIS